MPRLPLSPPAPRPFDVLGLGEIAVDNLCVVPRFPGRDDKVRMASHSQQGGGQIATAMVACQRLGLRAKYLGMVGDDELGRWSVAELEREGVDASDVRFSPDGQTQVAFILIEQDSGARTVVWRRDDRTVLRPHQLRAEELGQARAFHVDATGLAGGLEPLRWAREAGALTSIDIDHLLPQTEVALRLVDLCVVPEAFPALLTGEVDLERGMLALQRLNPDAVVCVTLGDQGCAALEDGRVVREPAFPVRAVDTTACGDVFHAAFLYAALKGMALRPAMRFANAAAALQTREVGGRPAIPTLAEVEALLSH